LGFGICGVKGQVMAVLRRTGLDAKIGSDNFYANTRTAVTAIIAEIHNGTDLLEGGCGNCPLTKYLPR
jgi:hypothetical protein